MTHPKQPTPTVNRIVQRLLAQIHAEVEVETLTALSSKGGVVMLHPLQRETLELRYQGADQFLLMDRNGGVTRGFRDRFMPEAWVGKDYMKGKWRPGQWSVRAERVDGNGRVWECDFGAHITDDFGDLVPVEGGAA